MVEIKNKPSPKGKKIAVLKKGSVLKILDTAKNWVKVSFQTKDGNKTGWVYKEFIVFVSEKGTPSSQKEFISSRSSI